MVSQVSNERWLAIFFSLVWISTFVIGYDAFTSNDPLFTVALFSVEQDWILFSVGVVFFLVVLIATWKRGRSWFYTGLAAYLVFVMLDINRVTPYFICYLGIVYCLCFFKKSLPVGLMVLASGIYIFSGLHKFNNGFYSQILPHIWFYSLGTEIPKSISYITPAIEVLAGLGLLFKKTRRVSTVILISIHLLLLWKLGPFKASWNLIVWPWNLIMIAVLLFMNLKPINPRNILASSKIALIPLLVFFFLIPSFSLTMPGWSNMGFQLYSGDVLFAELILPKKIDLPESRDRSPKSDEIAINLQTFSLRRRQIAVNAEPWVYKKIQQNFENHYQMDTRLKFYNEWGKPSMPDRIRNIIPQTDCSSVQQDGE